MKIFAKDYGVFPGFTDIKALEKMFDELKYSREEKELIFENGEYYIDASALTERMLYITNTVGDKEFSADEIPHKNRAGSYLNKIENLVINGNGARFIADGKCTNMAVEECENITIKNLSFCADKPDLHELRVVSVSAFSVQFEIDAQSNFDFNNGKLYFTGRDYRVRSDKSAVNAHWIGLIHKETPNKIERTSHPLLGAIKIKHLGGRRFRAIFLNTHRFRKDDLFYVFDVRRQYVGIFLNSCKNITLENIVQNFNYSLALVAQDCETITCEKLDFSPDKNSLLKMSSIADFVQICSCRGVVEIRNSNFCGAGDDCINTHGIHFKIKHTEKNNFIAKFMHPQTHGFNPLRRGDEIAFINSSDMLEYGRAKIIESDLINEYEIALKLSCDCIAGDCDVIEDISACPELIFENNTVNRIITRAVLYTSRGKCIIKNNRFISNSMSGILLSDDAKSWYESGMCCDVTIEGNTFDYCGETPILIKPENKIHNGAVHKNITIKNNVFRSYSGYCIKAKSCKNLLIENNTFSGDKRLYSENCDKVTKDF